MKKLFFNAILLTVMGACTYLANKGYKWAAVPFAPCLVFVGCLADF